MNAMRGRGVMAFRVWQKLDMDDMKRGVKRDMSFECLWFKGSDAIRFAVVCVHTWHASPARKPFIDVFFYIHGNLAIAFNSSLAISNQYSESVQR